MVNGKNKKSSLSFFHSETSRVIIPRKEEEEEEEIRENTAELSYQAGRFVVVWSGRVNLYG